jgi:hypothetical protein
MINKYIFVIIVISIIQITSINAQFVDVKKSYDIYADGYISWLVIISPFDTITTYSFTPVNCLNKEEQSYIDNIINIHFKDKDLITELNCYFSDSNAINLLYKLIASKSFTIPRSIDFPFINNPDDYINLLLDTNSIYNNSNISYVNRVLTYQTYMNIDTCNEKYILVKWLDKVKVKGEIYNLEYYEDFFNLQSLYLDKIEKSEKGVRIGDYSNYLIAKIKPTKMAQNDNYPILVITEIKECLSSYCIKFNE